VKKLILLIIASLFLTGCYDYQELNNRAIISGLAIDYNDENYLVTLEILNSKKSDSDKESSEKVYFTEGSGKTLSEAFQNSNLKISKEPYFSHLKILIISEKIAREKMPDIIDYMIREPNIRNIFIPVMAKDSDASDLIKTTTKENPICSEAIQSLLENNKSSNNIALNIDFESFVDTIVDKRKDAKLNTISKEEEQIVLEGIAAFKDEKLATILNKDEASIINTLNNTSKNHFIKTTCDDKKEKYITINLYNNEDTNIEIKENKLYINSKLEASIIEDECNLDFRKPDVYKKVEEMFKKEIETEEKEVIKKLQQYQTDILQINDIHYKKERKDLTDWYKLDVSFKTKLIINKNGLIFRVDTNE